MRITEEQVRQAEQKAEAAERERMEAEKAYGRSPGTAGAFDRHMAAIQQAEHAAVQARQLRAEYEEQQVVRAAREAAERAAAKEAAPAVKRLTKSRQEAVEALAEAKAAAVRALELIASHDRAVREGAAGMRSRGLPADDGERTGGTRDGRLMVDGVAFNTLDAPSLLAVVATEAIAEVWPQHPMARFKWPTFGGPWTLPGREEVLRLLRGGKRVGA